MDCSYPDLRNNAIWSAEINIFFYSKKSHITSETLKQNQCLLMETFLLFINLLHFGPATQNLAVHSCERKIIESGGMFKQLLFVPEFSGMNSVIC